MSRRELVQASFVAGLVPVPARLAAQTPTPRRTSFRPGEVWTDTTGTPIQAHYCVVRFTDDSVRGRAELAAVELTLALAPKLKDETRAGKTFNEISRQGAFVQATG